MAAIYVSVIFRKSGKNDSGKATGSAEGKEMGISGKKILIDFFCPPLWLLQGFNNLHLYMLRLFEMCLRTVSNAICCILNNNNKFWFWLVICGAVHVSGWCLVSQGIGPANCFPGHRDGERNTLMRCCQIEMSHKHTRYPVWHQLFSYMQTGNFFLHLSYVTFSLVGLHCLKVITVIRAVKDYTCDKCYIMENRMF